MFKIIKLAIKILCKINLNTLLFNFYYLPIRQALFFPFYISNKVRIIKLSGKVVIDGIIRPGMIKIGYGHVNIFDNKKSRSIWEVGGHIVFKGEAHIGHGCKIIVAPEGKINFGEYFTMVAESTIVCFKNISFGKNSLLSWDILCMDSDFHKIKDSSGQIINSPESIIVEDDVWIGCRSLILKGSKIPAGCVIGANSTVMSGLEFNKSVYAGIPVKCVKRNITWEK